MRVNRSAVAQSPLADDLTIAHEAKPVHEAAPAALGGQAEAPHAAEGISTRGVELTRPDAVGATDRAHALQRLVERVGLGPTATAWREGMTALLRAAVNTSAPAAEREIATAALARGYAIALAQTAGVSQGEVASLGSIMAAARIAGLAPGPGARTEHVIIVSIDGLRADALTRFRPPTLTRLMSEGSYSLAAQTVQPSLTLPSHTSMLTGVTPEVHGIRFNQNRMGEGAGHVQVPTAFELVNDQGLLTAAFFSKAKFEHIVPDGTIDHWQGPRDNLDVWSVHRTVPDVERYLGDNDPNLLFVHIAEPDAAGHTHGWMGRQYEAAVAQADQALARLIAIADRELGAGEYTLIVTADHGGRGREHGGRHPLETTIPWIAWGDSVEPGEITAPISTVDTAATALWLLGLPAPDSMQVRAVTSGFRPEAPTGFQPDNPGGGT